MRGERSSRASCISFTEASGDDQDDRVHLPNHGLIFRPSPTQPPVIFDTTTVRATSTDYNDNELAGGSSGKSDQRKHRQETFQTLPLRRCSVDKSSLSLL